MELPICSVTYSNESHSSDVGFLNSVVNLVDEYKQEYRDYFVGICHLCNYAGSTAKPLQRCGGCQLVGYCSRKCQKGDWTIHKYVCKEFPVVQGKNALHATVPWKEHITGLRERAAQLPHTNVAKSIFRNPRVCHFCRESRPELLTDCDCMCVSYCSKTCTKADIPHKTDCYHLRHVAQAHLLLAADKFHQSHVKDVSVCENFTPVFKWSDINHGILNKCMIPNDILTEAFILVNERLAYTMSLLYSLQTLPERRLSHCRPPLDDLTSLDIHIIIRNPSFDSEPWEIFMHRLPKLKQLKVVFIMQGQAFKPSITLNTDLGLHRCDDCESNDRVITYSVQQMQYHMFFSSPQYSRPDVVVVFGNTQEMSASDEDAIHSEISYRNMTFSRDTVLVLTDATMDLVRKGVKAVSAARPINQLVLPQINPLRGYSTTRAEIDADAAIINERYFFTCLRRI